MDLKSIIFIITGTLLLNGIVLSDLRAQKNSSGSFSIGVSARVVKSIEMVTIRDMQFGSLQPGQQEILIDPLVDSDSGKMIAIGIPNAKIRVSFVRKRTLTHTNGDETLTFNYKIAGNNEDDQNSAEILQTDNRNLDLNDKGEYYFWIGGHTNIENAQPGKYSGDFTIEVEYI